MKKLAYLLALSLIGISPLLANDPCPADEEMDKTEMELITTSDDDTTEVDEEPTEEVLG